MGKRVLISLIATVSLGALWWTDAGAATCLQYRTVGGSSMCTAWSTKGVLVELTYKQPCGPDDGEGGGGTACSAVADAVTNNSIAFCAHPTNTDGLPVTKIRCSENVRFFGEEVGCDPKHDEDGTGEGGIGHDKGKHKCKATIVLDQFGSCDATCAAAGLGPALDVTPITMDTNVAATVVPIGEDSGEGQASPCTPGETTTCTFTEHCSINPNKIEFNAIRPYQCKLTSVGGPPPPPPPPPPGCEVCVD